MNYKIGTYEKGRIEIINGVEHLVTTMTNDGTILYWIGDRGTILHRENGPAIIRKYGNNSFYLNGEKLTEYEFNRKIAKKRLKILDNGASQER